MKLKYVFFFLFLFVTSINLVLADDIFYENFSTTYNKANCGYYNSACMINKTATHSLYWSYTRYSNNSFLNGTYTWYRANYGNTVWISNHSTYGNTMRVSSLDSDYNGWGMVTHLWGGLIVKPSDTFSYVCNSTSNTQSATLYLYDDWELYGPALNGVSFSLFCGNKTFESYTINMSSKLTEQRNFSAIALYINIVNFTIDELRIGSSPTPNYLPYFSNITVSDTTPLPYSEITVDYTGFDNNNDQVYFAYSCSDLNTTGYIQDFKEDFETPYDNSDLGIPDYFNDSYNEVIDYDDSKVLNFSDTDVIGLELYADLKSPYSEYRGIITIDFKQLDYWTSFYPQGFMIRLQDILNPVAEVGVYLENNTQYSVWTTGSNGLWFKVLTLYDTGYMNDLNKITVNYDLISQTYNFSNTNDIDGLTESSNYALRNNPLLLKKVSLKTFANLNTSSNISLNEPYFTSLGGTFVIDNFLVYRFNGPEYYTGDFLSVNNYEFSHTCYYANAGTYLLTSYIADYYSKDWTIYNITSITVSSSNVLNQSDVLNASYDEVVNATDPLKVVKKLIGSSLKDYLENMSLYDTGKPVLWFIFICLFVWLLFIQYDVTKQLDFIFPLMISSIGCGFIAYLVDYTFQLISFAILLALSIGLIIVNSMRSS